uniref:Uncharacterized protein n=1 Tax=Heterorhabditis bacteriophora TaxID=37862 RepID=A0A1I7WVE2_HETBA
MLDLSFVFSHALLQLYFDTLFIAITPHRGEYMARDSIGAETEE